MRMRKICHFNGVGVISSANRLALSKQTGRRMTIFYQNRACETHKKVIFQGLNSVLLYLSAKLVSNIVPNLCQQVSNLCQQVSNKTRGAVSFFGVIKPPIYIGGFDT